MFEMLDDEIQYFGEEENFDHDDDQEIPAESRTRNGKKVRGNDREWKMKRSFQNPADFEASNLLNEIKSEFTCQRRKEFDYNTVHTYTCKMSRRVGYEKCPKEIRIIFPSDSLSVVVQETGVHHHIEKSDIADRPSVFKWSQQATKIIEQGLRNKLTPTVILNNNDL